MTIKRTINDTLTPPVLEMLARAFEEEIDAPVDYLPVTAIRAVAAGAAEQVLNRINYPYTQLPGIVRTEWGVSCPKFGKESAVADEATARRITENLNKAGHPATVVWRGVTDWQE